MKLVSFASGDIKERSKYSHEVIRVNWLRNIIDAKNGPKIWKLTADSSGLEIRISKTRAFISLLYSHIIAQKGEAHRSEFSQKSVRIS